MPLFGLMIALLLQAASPAYITRGDEVEERYRSYREKLSTYFSTLRQELEQTASDQLPNLADPPPAPVVYGYQLLPKLVPNDPPPPRPPDLKTEGRAYSWPNTQGFIDREEVKLTYSWKGLNDSKDAPSAQKRRILLRLTQEYRQLVRNQQTIDQYIQYNRFWQRSIHADRERFDRMTKVYELVTERERLKGKAQDGDGPDIDAINKVLSETLGPPQLPSFVEILRPDARKIVLRVPVYTDIDDEELLQAAERAIEDEWVASDDENDYSVDVVLRHLTIPDVQRGAHIDIAEHARRFPSDGAVLTAGANTTYSYTGRFIALGAGPLPHRVLAHEFGHVLGFRDGYFRGYRDLRDEGFEILELALNFEDIMSAPREGRVHPLHFKMLLASAKQVQGGW